MPTAEFPENLNLISPSYNPLALVEEDDSSPKFRRSFSLAIPVNLLKDIPSGRRSRQPPLRMNHLDLYLDFLPIDDAIRSWPEC
jgi:hypothetical protein